MKSIFVFLLKSLAFIANKFFVKCFSFAVRVIYTEYILKQIGKCGSNPVFCYRMTSAHGLEHVCIGNNFFASSGLILEAFDTHLNNKYNPRVDIGNNVRLGNDCHIGCVNKIVIGNNVLIASKVFIADHSHGDTTIESLKLPPNSREVISKGPVIIEDNVWIGEGVVILPNVKIGKNAIVGANSVVTKDVSENSVVGGNPAKLIKNLNGAITDSSTNCKTA